MRIETYKHRMLEVMRTIIVCLGLLCIVVIYWHVTVLEGLTRILLNAQTGMKAAEVRRRLGGHSRPWPADENLPGYSFDIPKGGHVLQYDSYAIDQFRDVAHFVIVLDKSDHVVTVQFLEHPLGSAVPSSYQTSVSN